MKLVTFTEGDRRRLGLVAGASVTDLTAVEPDLTDMVDLIAAGPSALSSLVERSRGAPVFGLDEVEPDAALRPRKNVFAVGRNYLEHVREVPGDDAENRPPPEHPIVFSKPPTSMIGPGQAIDTANDPTGTTDYEGELAVVIGTAGKRRPTP